MTGGGYLSDAYRLLPHTEALAENEEFHKKLPSEELLQEKPEGVVIGQCPDGDAVVLCKDGAVLRFSHEAPEIRERWLSLAQFIADAVDM